MMEFVIYLAFLLVVYCLYLGSCYILAKHDEKLIKEVKEVIYMENDDAK